MAVNYAYAYAEIDDATHMCIGVVDTSDPNFAGPTTYGTTYVVIPDYNEDYIFRYYIGGNWYEDDAGTVPYVPA